jgi:hypothetical protein
MGNNNLFKGVIVSNIPVSMYRDGGSNPFLVFEVRGGAPLMESKKDEGS